MAVVRELLTRLGFVTDEKKLKDWDKRVASMKDSLRFLAKAAAITGGAITAMAFTTAKAGDEIAKTSERLGIGVEALQEWRFASDRAGVGAATFDMAFQRFGRRAAEASRGTGEAKGALAELGIELTDVNGKLRDADTLLTESLIALSKQEDAFTRNRLAMKLFDSEGVRLVQLVAEGADGMAALRKQARDLGGVMSEEMVESAVAFTDEWSNVKFALKGIVFVIGSELLPLFTDTFRGVAKWVSENRKLASGLVKATIAIGAIITALAAASVAVKALTLAWALLNSQIFLIPLLIAAAIAAIVLITQDILAFTEGKRSIFGQMLEGFKALGTLAGIAISKAFRSAWERIRTEGLAIWSDIVARVSEMWGNFFDTRIQPILEAIEKVRTIAGTLGGIASEVPGVRALAGAAGKAATGSVAGSVAQFAINMVVNSPPGTSATGVARAVATGLKSRVKELSSGLIGLRK
jgi:TP901 family phage tail tape measure protein